MVKNNELECPPIGMAFWLLKGGRALDRLEWLIENRFQGVSLLQSAMEFDRQERNDLAQAIKQAGLYVTYHGNVNHHLLDGQKLDEDFARLMIDDVLWWHENAGGVYSCCSDAIDLVTADGVKAFNENLNRQHMHLLAEGLSQHRIRTGIENSTGNQRFADLSKIIHFKQACALPEMGMLFDAAHGNIHVRGDGVAGESEIGAYVRALPFEIFEIHFSDNRGMHDEHKKIGYGNLDLGSLFKSLKTLGFQGKFTVEVCLDIQSGQYASDIYDSAQTAPLLSSQNLIRTEWCRSE